MSAKFSKNWASQPMLKSFPSSFDLSSSGPMPSALAKAAVAARLAARASAKAVAAVASFCSAAARLPRSRKT
eukprot:8886599-Pyramimonas_sp.AAC.1